MIRSAALKILATLLLLLAGIPAAAQEEPPVPREPLPMMRSYLVYASNLQITPQQDTTKMLFSGGVRIEGRGLTLYTDSLELVLRGDAIPLDRELEVPEGEIPSLPDALENREKGEDLAQIARELELPKARFQSDSVRELRASGNVRFEGHGVLITTSSVQSTDGGETWSGSGRTTLAMTDDNSSTSISSDGIHLDTTSGIVTASGSITGRYVQQGVPQPLLLATQDCIFDMNSGIVSVPGEVQLSYGEIDMLISPLEDSGELQQSVATELDPLVPAPTGRGAEMAPAPPGVSIDLEQRIVRARGSMHVQDPERSIELYAYNLDYLMDEGLMRAWQVVLTDIGHGMTLNAPLVEIFTAEKRLVASGMPLLRYGESSYTGEKITVTEESDELLVIEIEGQQLATLHMDELRDFGDGEAAGTKEADEAPQPDISSQKSSTEE